jgi:iron complex transport system ATP-binding protein
MALEVKNLTCGYLRKEPNVSNVEFTLKQGQFLCLLGPNGSGKTALLKTLAGILPVRDGSFSINGIDMSCVPARKKATLLAYVPQSHAPVFPFSVKDVVVMGRAGRWGRFGAPSSTDWDAAEEALSITGMLEFIHRRYSELSGGERQMIMIARALAQGADVLALDEPASSLDFGNQLKMLKLLCRLAQNGKAVLMTSHHPEHAMRYASHVATIQHHHLKWLGAPQEHLTSERLKEIYNIDFLISNVVDRNAIGIPVCVPQTENSLYEN